MSADTTRAAGRTVRSGAYLRQLFSQAELMDARLQRDICSRIQQARKEAGYTQQEMADLLGMTMRGYQNYESTRVPFRWLDKIAELTGKSQEWLLRGDLEAATPSLTPAVVVDRLDQLEQSVESLRLLVVEALDAAAERRVAR